MPEVTGKDLKDYRHGLHMTVDTFAGFVGAPRQQVAGLERLERPLTSDEFRSVMPKPVPFNSAIMKIIQFIGPKAR